MINSLASRGPFVPYPSFSVTQYSAPVIISCRRQPHGSDVQHIIQGERLTHLIGDYALNIHNIVLTCKKAYGKRGGKPLIKVFVPLVL